MLIDPTGRDDAHRDDRVAIEVLPIWNECECCSRMRDCSDPFPPSGLCSHPNERVEVAKHPARRWPRHWGFYEQWIHSDWELKSCFLRWQLGKVIPEADFLKIREKALAYGITPFPGPRWLIWEFIDADLILLYNDFAVYYGIDRERIRWALQAAFNWALATALPENIVNNVKIGGNWYLYMVDIIRMCLRDVLEIGYLKLDSLNDKAFRKKFEQEWEKLLPFRGFNFNFRVIPRVSWDDLVRYQKLPYGKAVIRSSISCYVTHQAYVYPHLLKTCADNFTEVAFFRRLRKMYQPLLDKTTRRVTKNLQVQPNDVKVIKDIQEEVSKTFETALQEFDFNWRPNQEERVVGPIGVVGLTEDTSKRQQVDEVLEAKGISLRTQDAAIYAFAHYIEQKMVFWVKSTYPPEEAGQQSASFDTCEPATDFAKGVASENEGEEFDVNQGRASEFYDSKKEPSKSSWSNNTEFFLDEEPDFTGPDQIPYMMIRKAARRYGLSEDQLRRMDKANSFSSRRAGEVFGSACPVAADIRLYPCTPESDWLAEIAKGRAITHSSALTGNELNRKQAALHLGVKVRQLRSLEDSGKVQPRRKGSRVIYDEAILERAAFLLQERKLRVAAAKLKRKR